MIVVTAPTSQIGRQVRTHLRAAGAEVRVIARNPAGITEEVVPGSHADPEVVAKAFAGADAVFWLVPADPRAESADAAYVDFTRPAAAAFVSAGVRRVVGISALGRGQGKEAGHVTASLAMDDLITGTGVDYRALTMPSFMDNVLRQAGAIKDRGVFYGPGLPDRKNPLVATKDIAAVAARLQLDTSWTGQAEVPVLGPEDLSPDDMARIMSEVLGRPVRYQQIPGAAFKDNLIGAGMSEPMAQSMLDMALAKNDGLDNAVQRTPESSSPTSFRQWCEENGF